jgi:hypothetical protein
MQMPDSHLSIPRNETDISKTDYNVLSPSSYTHIQGADDKLGQFLNQSFKATDYRRNVFQHSLESCTFLVLHNVNKLSLFLKTCQQCM